MEGEKIAAMEGITIKDSFQKTIEVIKNTANNYSSMLQDIMRGKKTEISSVRGINSEAVNNFIRKKKKLLTSKEYIRGILAGDVSLLSQSITLLESSLPSHQEVAAEILAGCLPYVGKSVRVGITGVPGVGKSSFIEALGVTLTEGGKKLAILAIDPSSEKSGGSILGDKTRMEKLATSTNAFIRPSPSTGSLGGVASKTRETILLCEAAGYEVVFVETVGVGQSEIAVHSMVDFFLLLMLPGAGDEIQGMKRGIMEMADMILITKADGDNLKAVAKAVKEYESALHLFPVPASGWLPRVKTCSVFENKGIARAWEIILEYVTFTKNNGYFEKKRSRQARYWFFEALDEGLKQHFYGNEKIKRKIDEMEKAVIERHADPYKAARDILSDYFY